MLVGSEAARGKQASDRADVSVGPSVLLRTSKVATLGRAAQRKQATKTKDDGQVAVRARDGIVPPEVRPP